MDATTSQLDRLQIAYILIDRIAHAAVPDRRLVLYLMQLAREADDANIRESAELSLGTLVGRIRYEHPQWAAEAGTWMAEALEQAQTVALRFGYCG